MKSFFHALLVLIGIQLDRQGMRVSALYSCKDIESTSVTQQLKNYLFCNYNEEVRPTENYRNATVVLFGLYLQQFEVNELANMVDFHVWSRMEWKDHRLSWEPSRFNNIDSLHIMSYEIWVPDIVVHSASNMDIDMEMPLVECLLHHKGTVVCVPSTVYTAYCESDHTWWPYDTMNCSLYIASWSHSSNELDIRFMKLDSEGQLSVDVYEKNSEWNVVKTSLSERVTESKFGLEFTSKMLSYHLLLRRHSSMYTAAYVTMTLVLTTMTLMALWLEPRSTERMIIANFNFILHLFCLQDLQWNLPFNGAYPPKLLLFYENSLVMAAFSLILTSLLRHLQELNANAPAWISSTTIAILKSRVGQVFLVSILDPKVSARMELNADDNTNLVSLDKRESTWRYTSILIGWLAFLSALFVYAIMFAVFLPTSRNAKYLSSSI